MSKNRSLKTKNHEDSDGELNKGPEMILAFAKSGNKLFRKMGQASTANPDETILRHSKEFVGNFAEELSKSRNEDYSSIAKEFTKILKKEPFANPWDDGKFETFLEEIKQLHLNNSDLVSGGINALTNLHLELVNGLSANSKYVAVHEENFRYMVEASKMLDKLNHADSEFPKLQKYALEMLAHGFLKALLIEECVALGMMNMLFAMNPKIN